MNTHDVTIGGLAVAGLLFNSLTPYNASLLRLRSATGNALDLFIKEHRNEVVRWLNHWGCRHLPKEQHGVASESIGKWYEAHCRGLFSEGKPLWQLEDGELDVAARAYGDLKDRPGALRDRGGAKRRVHIGPTAASKILFALRPEALMPWDHAMRSALGHDGGPLSYLQYLLDVRDLTMRIESLCQSRDLSIEDLPRVLGRPEATVLSLVNEYIWVTLTRRVTLPSSETLTQWASLG